MNGFITESVSKLYDGFGTAFYVLGLVFSTRLLNLAVEKYLGYPGKFIFILLLLVLAMLSLEKGISKRQEEPNSAGYGITSGVLLWQAVQFFSPIWQPQVFSFPSLILWGIVCLITMIFYRKMDSLSIRFFVLVFLLMWGGFLFIEGNNLVINLQPLWKQIFFSGRLAALAGTLMFTWWIVFKSVDSANRKTAGIFLAVCAMLASLWI